MSFDIAEYGDVDPGTAHWPMIDYGIIESTEDIAPRLVSDLHFEDPPSGLLGGMPPRKKKGGGKKNNEKQSRKKPVTGFYIKPTNKSNDIAPPTRFVELTYNDEDTVMQAASPYIVTSYQFTAVYDTSTGILTTSYAGFEENTAFYDENQVYRTEATWDVANNETSTQLRVAMVPSCFDGSANISSYQQAVDFCEAPYSSGLKMLERASGGPAKYKFEMTLFPKEILGNNKYFTDSKYSGTFNSNPAVVLFLNLVVISLSSSTNLTNGVTGNFSMRSLVRFWNFRKIVDPSPDPPKKKPPLVIKDKDLDSDSEELVVVASRKKDKKKI